MAVEICAHTGQFVLPPGTNVNGEIYSRPDIFYFIKHCMNYELNKVLFNAMVIFINVYTFATGGIFTTLKESFHYNFVITTLK